MASYGERLGSTGVVDLMSQLMQKVDQLSDEQISDVDDNLEVPLVDRLSTLVDYGLATLGAVDARLVAENSIVGLGNALRAVHGALDAILPLAPDATTMSQLNELGVAVEGLATALQQLPSPLSADWRESVSQAASTYRRSLGQQMVGLTDELESRRTSLLAKYDGLAERVSETEALASNLAAQIEAAKGLLDRTESRVDSTVAEFQKQFSEAQEKRTADAAEAREKLLDEANKQLQEQEQTASSLVAAIQQQVDDAARLVSAFAAAGTANAYGKEAKDQGDKADAWRRVALVLGVLAALAAGAVLIHSGSGEQNWQAMVGKLAVGLTVGGLAGYAASQSSRHRRREESARHLELNLATFGPLSEELGDQALEAARTALVEAMLTKDTAVAALGSENPTLNEGQINLVQKLAETLWARR